jgi:hypothetical protein
MEYLGKRISYVRKADELSIVISAYSVKSKNNILLAWFIAWTLGGLIVLVSLFRTPAGDAKTMLLVWLGFWLYFEYKAWKAYTWRRFGKEVIKIGKSTLFYKRDNRGAGKVQQFQTEFIQNLEKHKGRPDAAITHFLSSYWVIAGETISFKYYGKEVLLGMQLDDKEAGGLLKLIAKEIKI